MSNKTIPVLGTDNCLRESTHVTSIVFNSYDSKAVRNFHPNDNPERKESEVKLFHGNEIVAKKILGLKFF